MQNPHKKIWLFVPISSAEGWDPANGEAMAKWQVKSILQPYPHDHIHGEGH